MRGVWHLHLLLQPTFQAEFHRSLCSADSAEIHHLAMFTVSELNPLHCILLQCS